MHSCNYFQEAESLIGQRTLAAKHLFESRSSEQEIVVNKDKTRPPPRKLKEFRPTNNDDR